VLKAARPETREDASGLYDDGCVGWESIDGQDRAGIRKSLNFLSRLLLIAFILPGRCDSGREKKRDDTEWCVHRTIPVTARLATYLHNMLFLAAGR
jgi:hypothetical protein